MPWPVFPGHHGLLLEKIAAQAIVKKARAEGNILDDPEVSFQLGKVLGQGTFGKVHEAMNTKTGEMVAIKRIELKSHKLKEQIRMAESEIALMTTLRHPHIVSIRGSMLDGEIFNIIMELVSGSSLADMTARIGALHENVTRKFTKQLLSALQYCHAMHCVHRDIKGKNILLTTEGTVRICDFGSAKIREETIDKDAVSVTYSYTPLWVAPETLNAKMYNEKVDIWALGCVVIEMASGKDPWSEKRFQSSYQAIFHIGSSNEIPLIPASLSEEGKDFCRKCLTRDPEQRPSATELLKHPFVSSIDIDAIVASEFQEPEVAMASSRASSSACSSSSSSTASSVPMSGPQWVVAPAAGGEAAIAAAASDSAENQMQVIRDMLDSKKTTMQLATPPVLVTMERKSLSPSVSTNNGPAAAAAAATGSGVSSSSHESHPLPQLPLQVNDGNESHTMVSSHSAAAQLDASMQPSPLSVMQSLSPHSASPAMNIDRPDSESAPNKAGHDQPDKNMSSKPFNVVYTFGTMTTGGEPTPMKLDGSVDHKSPFASGDEQSRSESRVYSYQSAAELNSSRSDMSLSHSVLQFSEGWKTFNIVPNV